MPDNLDKLKFILTGSMTYKLLKIANLKKELLLIEGQMKTYKNTIHYHSLNNSKKILENKIKSLTKEFIKEFQIENINEIKKYNKLKNNSC